MKSSLTPDTAIVAVETRPEPAARSAGGGAGDARSFLSTLVVIRTALVLLVATLLLATLAIFVLALALSLPVDLARWLLGSGAGLSGWGAGHLLQLLKISAVCGLVVSPVGCVLFAVDLRRQGWR